MRRSSKSKSPRGSKAKDEDDKRLHHIWTTLSSRDLSGLPLASDRGETVIVAYPDDEGIRLNDGRPGAKSGPEAILKYLGRMVVRNSPSIFVLPNFLTVASTRKKLSLPDRHALAEKIVSELLDKQYRVLTLGGGHDYGFPDASAFLTKTRGKVVNIDAHLDMRPVIEDCYHSGTAFRRLIHRFGGQSLITYGYMPHTNALAHQTFGETQKSVMLTPHESLPPITGDVGLSVCLDAFADIRAVSAPQMVGLSSERGLDCIRRFRSQSSWLGLYEVSPRWDPLTEDAARLAAVYAYYFIHREL